MDNQLVKKLSWFWIVFALWPLFIWYLTNLFPAALWCWAWIPVWAWFVHSKRPPLDRGLIFIVVSIAVAVIGRHYVEPIEHKEVVDMVYQIILIISGGVGGNMIAYELLERKKKS